MSFQSGTMQHQLVPDGFKMVTVSVKGPPKLVGDVLVSQVCTHVFLLPLYAAEMTIHFVELPM
jgi:hypothetical protein